MLSKNVVLFCQKGTTDQKTTSYAVLKGHFWITKKRTTVLDSPILSFFAKLFKFVLSRVLLMAYSSILLEYVLDSTYSYLEYRFPYSKLEYRFPYSTRV